MTCANYADFHFSPFGVAFLKIPFDFDVIPGRIESVIPLSESSAIINHTAV
jgi:hypothetical protein